MAALVRRAARAARARQRRRRRDRHPGGARPADLAGRGDLARAASSSSATATARPPARRTTAGPAVPDARERWPRSTPRAADAAAAGPGPGRAVPARSPTGDVPLDRSADRAEVARAGCWRCPGIGPWTADYVAMRALGDPDVVPAHRHRRAPRAALDRATTRAAAEAAERWRPWRSYALMHLWSTPRPPADRNDPDTAEGELTCGPPSTHPSGPLRVVARDGA